MLPEGSVHFPTRVHRLSASGAGCGDGDFAAKTRPLKLFGPTCDSGDALPRPFELPADIAPGDWIEFGQLGAYSIANRTRFNGFYPEAMVEIAGAGALPPGMG